MLTESGGRMDCAEYRNQTPGIIERLKWTIMEDMTADELAYQRYCNGEYSYQDYLDVCEQEGCEPEPPKNN